MLDILLGQSSHDIELNEWGDLKLTHYVGQAIKVRLLWFWQEWRLNRAFGVPYFEDVLIKNPSLDKIRSILQQEILKVEEVTEARITRLKLDPKTRGLAIEYTATASHDREVIKDRVIIWATSTG